MKKATRKNMLVVGLFAGLAVLFSWPLFTSMNNWGIQDWDWYLTLDALTRESFLKYGQVPLWTPYWKGGMPLLAHPESNVFSVALLIQLLFGELWGAKINIVLHLFLGLCTMFMLARWLRLSHTASFLAGSIFMLSSMYLLILTAGMEWGYAIAYMPLALYCFLRCDKDPSWRILTGVIMAIMWLGGGVYPFTITFLLFGTYALVSICNREMEIRKASVTLVVVALIAFLLGAFKFLPSIELTQQFPRDSELYAGFSVQSFLYGLFGRDQTLAAILGTSSAHGFWTGFSQGMDEVGMYIGILAFIPGIVGLIVRGRKQMPLLVCLIVFILLAFGNRSEPLSLWDALHNIPPYSIMRSVERFRFVVILILALFAGIGLDYFVSRLGDRYKGRRWPEMLGCAFVALIVIDLFMVNGPILKDAFSIPPIPTPPRGDLIKQIGGFPEYDPNGPRYQGGHDLYTSYGASYPAWLANLGNVYAYFTLSMPQNVTLSTDPGYRGEIFLEGTSGTARYRHWSPNRLVVDVKADQAGWLMVNQNYYPGWRACGAKVESRRGLLAVQVGPDVHKIELSYLPTSFLVGAVLSFLTLLAIGYWYWRMKNPFGTGEGCLT